LDRAIRETDLAEIGARTPDKARFLVWRLGEARGRVCLMHDIVEWAL
jgi:hypothetical protein